MNTNVNFLNQAKMKLTLTKCAEKHNSEKGLNGYTNIYESYIPSTGKYKLFEIGIDKGRSIKMWNNYNPDLELYFIEIQSDHIQLVDIDDNITIFLGDVTDYDFIHKIVSKYGKFDFIIDGNQHVKNKKIHTFCNLWDMLTQNGIYFIEDLHENSDIDEFILKFKRMTVDKNIHVEYKVCNDNKLLTITK
jgi:hypothetical protein